MLLTFKPDLRLRFPGSDPWPQLGAPGSRVRSAALRLDVAGATPRGSPSSFPCSDFVLWRC